ncbi:hypothetical protein [Tahibacter aquaticus]|uniref:hypothetical protein n=1 Tax=Tahibacter aquaticus TaxID=520092 RepID=UPI0010600519|nr:hypothetical protein [Tahibacter aquaticus]
MTSPWLDTAIWLAPRVAFFNKKKSRASTGDHSVESHTKQAQRGGKTYQAGIGARGGSLRRQPAGVAARAKRRPAP